MSSPVSGFGEEKHCLKRCEEGDKMRKAADVITVIFWYSSYGLF
jgi:hypothetical protein